MSMSTSGHVAPREIEVEGRPLRLTNLGKVLSPKVGFTKAEVLDYYRRVAPALLPHLAGRPTTLKRYPDGVQGESFYEKNCPAHRPAWVKTAPIFSEGHGHDVNYCLVDDLATRLWVENLAALELHVSLARARAVALLLEERHPDKVVSQMRKDLRGGKVLVDWSQNDEHKTTVAVYSLRAEPEPTVSLPVRLFI